MFAFLFACHRVKLSNLLVNVIAYRLDINNQSTSIFAEFLLVICIRLLSNCLQIVSNGSHIRLKSVSHPRNGLPLVRRRPCSHNHSKVRLSSI